jgi:hypothetical protein
VLRKGEYALLHSKRFRELGLDINPQSLAGSLGESRRVCPVERWGIAGWRGYASIPACDERR